MTKEEMTVKDFYDWAVSQGVENFILMSAACSDPITPESVSIDSFDWEDVDDEGDLIYGHSNVIWI